MKKTKNIFFGVSLFYLTFYLPIALMAYLPPWYAFNCKFHSRCNYIGYENALKYIDELTVFFRHGNRLSGDWTVKEKLHLSEVRDILDALTVVAVLCIIILIVTFNRSKLSKNALVNFAVIFSFLLLLPFFKIFWVKIFHPLLFDNNLWRNNYMDRSFYIMPRIFFKSSMIFLIAISSLLNGLLWFSFRCKNKSRIQPTPISAVKVKKGKGNKSAV